ncbi:glycoside hydrolase family 16 protein [Frondihabitans australicus]|uniref:Glycosyl hydrolase family 16 n=1 Tax=Frondihabitans australicus TaxID=386892 RepID=A0A495ICD7_9MICO|nr:glycoside hydrolase family 16 protein [Frondihabitans australicus]RKR73579.1 glycosyl hydrolase family 16 [Frondihabitans australicus]
MPPAPERPDDPSSRAPSDLPPEVERTAHGRRRKTSGGDSGAVSRRAILTATGGAAVLGLAAVATYVTDPFGSQAAQEPANTPTRGPSPRATTPTPTPEATETPTAEPTPTETPSETATAEPTESAPAPAVGAMPAGDVTSYGIRWTPVFSEDFTTPAATGRVLSAYPKMSAYMSGKDTSGYGEYAPNQVLSVHDSVLDFHLHSENGQPLVASVLPDDYAPHTYCRVSMRYRVTSAPGYKFVGILWPSSNDWNQGEIDWPEGDLDARARPASQVVGLLNSAGQHVFYPLAQWFAPTDQTGFHVATTEWSRGIVRFYWDDKPIAVVTQGVPTAPMRVTLQAETWVNAGPVPTSADAHVEVDWVVIYQQA